jgi:hypothetical protein
MVLEKIKNIFFDVICSLNVIIFITFDAEYVIVP